MRPLPAQADYLQLVIYDDDQTPQDFVVGLVRSVFGQSSNDANSVMATVERRGKAVCGTYPRAVAEVLFQTAQQRIEASGHSLLMTAEAGDDAGGNSCKLCGDFAGENQVRLAGKTAAICDDCTLAVADNVADISRTKQFKFASEALEWHFAGVPDDQMVATSRQFPGHMRADVQTAIDNLFSAAPIRFFGIHERHRYETLNLRGAWQVWRSRARASRPAQYHDVDIGESAPVKCLDNGLWLCRWWTSCAMRSLLSAHREYDQETGTRIEIAVPAGAIGAAFVKRCFSELESAVNTARAYRGKVLSLDADGELSGTLARDHGPQAAAGSARGRDPARGHTEIARPQCPELRRKSRAASPAWAIDPQGHPALRAARHRQDPHHPLSGEQFARSHHADHHGGAGRAALRST